MVGEREIMVEVLEMIVAKQFRLFRATSLGINYRKGAKKLPHVMKEAIKCEPKNSPILNLIKKSSTVLFYKLIRLLI
jgi:hypothetical protein